MKTDMQLKAARMRVLPAGERYAFRPDQEPLITGLKWANPGDTGWRLVVEVTYQDGVIDAAPLSEFTIGGGNVYMVVLPNRGSE